MPVNTYLLNKTQKICLKIQPVNVSAYCFHCVYKMIRIHSNVEFSPLEVEHSLAIINFAQRKFNVNL